jgi:hypothetical protein
MNKVLFGIIIIIFIFCNLLADTKDLPDVEISGPTIMKTVAGKGSILYHELLIPDIVDSLKPSLPRFPQEIDKIVEQDRYAAFIDAGSNFDIRANFVAKRFISVNNSITSSMESRHFRSDWSNLYFNTTFLRDLGDADLSTAIKVLNTKSNAIIKSHYDNSLTITYHFSNNLFKKYPIDVTIENEIHNNQVDYNKVFTYYKKNYTNHGLKTILVISQSNRLTADLLYKQSSPLVELKTEMMNNDEEKKLDFVKELSLFFSNNRLVPGMYLSKRIQINSNNNIHIYQRSSANAMDNYDITSKYLWQYPIKKSLVSFKPIDLSFIWDNSSINIANNHLAIKSEYNVSYSIDEPILSQKLNSLVNKDLPQVTNIRALYNTLKIAGTYDYRNTSFNQSIAVQKGWNAQNDYQSMAYIPLVSLISSFDYNGREYLSSLWLKQYYNTKDDLDSYIRESIDAGARVGYNIRPDLLLYAEADNILNKGQYTYRTMPAKPMAIKAGFLLTF